MPKKKVQHKGKPKHASEESEDCAFRKIDVENAEEEYTTVVDFETNKKYSKRLIESNWAKYDADPSDIEGFGQGDELPKTDDLKFLLETASSDCAHFEFSSEKLWRSEKKNVPPSKIFNLDLNVLSSGLACVPFHERLGMDENDLTAEDKQRFEEAAKNSWKEYESIRKKFSKKSEDSSKVKNVEKSIKTLEDSIKEKLDLSVKKEENEICSKVGELSKENSDKKTDSKIDNKNSDQVDKNKQNTFFSEIDENLEDWLDSVLDD